MLTFDIPQSALMAILLGAVRAAAWLVVCPPFNARGIPGSAKALLSVAIALPLAPAIQAALPAGITTWRLLFELVGQAMIGAGLGFCTHLLFAAVQAAGSLIDLFGGFALAFSFDPLANAGISAFGRFYNLIATTLLFTTGAYQLVLTGFTRSYRALPATDALSLETMQRLLNGGFGEMFLAALQIGGPLIGILFLTDVALGLLSRVSPALNAFGLGFPAKILLTLVIAGSGLALLPEAVRVLIEKSTELVLTIIDRS